VTKKLYLWPFAEAVKANVSSVMCSYNKVGSAWACESGTLITNIRLFDKSVRQSSVEDIFELID
jgi:hypothetical protein